jgi:hypothetical protein
MKAGGTGEDKDQTSKLRCPNVEAWISLQDSPNKVLFIGIVGGGVQLDPLSTAATNRPIVPVPGDYDHGETGGMMIGRRNRSTRRKPAPIPLCPPQTHMLCPDANPDRRGWEGSG